MSIVAGHLFEFHYPSVEVIDKIKSFIASKLSSNPVFQQNLTVLRDENNEIRWFDREGVIGFHADSDGFLFHRSENREIFDPLVEDGTCSKVVLTYWPDGDLDVEAVICEKSQEGLNRWFHSFSIDDIHDVALESWFENGKGGDDDFESEWEENGEELITEFVQGEIDDFSPRFHGDWEKID